MKYVIILPLFLASCAMGVNVSPIDVTHHVDLAPLREYYATLCLKELGKHATNEQLNSCVDAKLQEFFERINS